MVASVDGKTAVDGKASGLGTKADRTVMRTLRSKVDAVMVGGGTLRAERLSLSLDEGDQRPRPLAVILTNSGDIRLESNLVRDPRQDVLVLLSEDANKDAARKLDQLAEVRRAPTDGSGDIDLAKALRLIRGECGVDVLLCEGGPALSHALISANLANELFITLAPTLIGHTASGTHSTLDSSRGEAERLRLLSAHPVGDELFLRYAIDQEKPPA